MRFQRCLIKADIKSIKYMNAASNDASHLGELSSGSGRDHCCSVVPKWLRQWKPPGEVQDNTFFCVGKQKAKYLKKAADFQGHTNLVTFSPYHLPSLPPAKCSLSSQSLQRGDICPWTLGVSSQLIINHHNIPYVKHLYYPWSMENCFVSWVINVLVPCHSLFVKLLFCQRI